MLYCKFDKRELVNFSLFYNFLCNYMQRTFTFSLLSNFFSEVETEIVKAKRTTRERPISFSKMDDIKNRWESTSQQGRRESQREARKEEIAGIRSRLFMVRKLTK